MPANVMETDVTGLVDGLHFREKVDRSLALIDEARRACGDGLVVANSFGTCVVWDLAKRVSPDIRGFGVLTPYSPRETVEFADRMAARCPELRIFRAEGPIPPRLYQRDPDRCCELLKVEPTRRAIREMGVTCWVSGIRCTSGGRRAGALEFEEAEPGLVKLNPILPWHEREVWQYAAIYKIDVNPLYAQGYRSLGCTPCTHIAAGPSERAGRWIGTSKCGGECGIHTKPLKLEDGAGI